VKGGTAERGGVVSFASEGEGHQRWRGSGKKCRHTGVSGPAKNATTFFVGDFSRYLRGVAETRHPAVARDPVFANAKTCVADTQVFHCVAMKNLLRSKSSLRSAWAPLFSGVTRLWNNFMSISTKVTGLVHGMTEHKKRAQSRPFC